MSDNEQDSKAGASPLQPASKGDPPSIVQGSGSAASEEGDRPIIVQGADSNPTANPDPDASESEGDRPIIVQRGGNP